MRTSPARVRAEGRSPSEAAEMMQTVLSNPAPGSVVIGISGCSRAGKTWTARVLRDIVNSSTERGWSAAIVGQDRFWERCVKVTTTTGARVDSAEEPLCTNHAAFAVAIRAHMQTHPVVIAEGFQLVHSAEVARLLTHTIHFDVERDEARRRRVATRDAVRNPNPLSAAEFDSLLWPAHERYVSSKLQPLIAAGRVLQLPAPRSQGHVHELVQRIIAHALAGAPTVPVASSLQPSPWRRGVQGFGLRSPRLSDQSAQPPSASVLTPPSPVANTRAAPEGEIAAELARAVAPRSAVDVKGAAAVLRESKESKDLRDRLQIEEMKEAVAACAAACATSSRLPEDAAIDLEEQRAALRWAPLSVSTLTGVNRAVLQTFTPFAAAPRPSLAQLQQLAERDRVLDRAMGCLVGLAVGDAVGHPLEFLPVASDSGEGHSAWSLASVLRDERSNTYLRPRSATTAALLSGERGRADESRVHAPGYRNPLNQFGLDAGQWTDDASMSLCLADSLLKCGKLDGSDVRITFWSWWHCGLNNAFRKDARKPGSVGLGGNIARSLSSMKPGVVPPPTYAAGTQDAGNGSLMRLAPVALHHLRVGEERCVRGVAALHADARASSLTTHPGPIAAEACAFLAHLIAEAVFHFDAPDVEDASDAAASRAFLINVADGYDAMLAATCSDRPGLDELRRLLRAAEPEGSAERCWNWRSERLDIGSTMRARGCSYNGYPNSEGYFGSFCLDGLAMALHSVAQTSSFDAAIERCVNLLGDADTTGAIAGQIAGAMYGYHAVHPKLRGHLHDWDDGQVALRAALLVTAPLPKIVEPSRPTPPPAAGVPMEAV